VLPAFGRGRRIEDACGDTPPPPTFDEGGLFAICVIPSGAKNAFKMAPKCSHCLIREAKQSKIKQNKAEAKQNNGAKDVPKWSQNGPKIVPKSSQNGPQIVRK